MLKGILKLVGKELGTLAIKKGQSLLRDAEIKINSSNSSTVALAPVIDIKTKKRIA